MKKIQNLPNKFSKLSRKPTIDGLIELLTEFNLIYDFSEINYLLTQLEGKSKFNVRLLFRFIDLLLQLDLPELIESFKGFCKLLDCTAKERKQWEKLMGLLGEVESESLQESKAIFELQTSSDYKGLTIGFLNYLAALIQVKIGQYSNSTRPLDLALDSFEELGELTLQCWVHRTRGRVQERLGHGHSALLSYLRGQKISQKAGLVASLCDFSNKLGLVYLQIGEVHRAKEALKFSLRAAKKVKSEYLIACASLELADEALLQGNHEEALNYLLSAKQSFETFSAKEKLAYTCYDLYRCYLASGNLELQEQAMSELSILIKGMPDVEGLKLRAIAAQALNFCSLGYFDAAIEVIEATLFSLRHLSEISDYQALESLKSNLIIEKIVTNHNLLSVSDASDLAQKSHFMGISLGQYLQEHKVIKPVDYYHILLDHFEFELADHGDYKLVPMRIKEVIPYSFARENAVLPIGMNESTITVVLSDPLNQNLLQQIRNLADRHVKIKIDDQTSILRHVSACYSIQKESLLRADARDTIEAILDIAIEVGASDIHLFPDELALNLQFRIDGTMHHVEHFELDQRSRLINVCKVMAELDVAVSHAPQDGRFDFSGYAFRVSTVPVLLGEKLVMRLVRQQEFHLELLGMDESVQRGLLRTSSKHNGLLLVTGPTGAGKTSTLYALMHHLNDYQRSILTVEDPVENELINVAQTPVNPSRGFHFHDALKAFLRQDPDVILVGEIRDPETAQIAIRASMTGIMVFSTLHTYNAYSTIGRLHDLGISPHFISESLQGVMSQRLVRQLCASCKSTTDLDLDKYYQFREYTDELEELSAFDVFSSVGCPECFNIGFQGRTMICEWLEINAEVRDLITSNARSKDYARYYKKARVMSLARSGFLKIIKGETTFDEVLGVV